MEILYLEGMSERKENLELLARRAAALKNNLRKRKEQSSSRSALGHSELGHSEVSHSGNPYGSDPLEK